MKDRVLLDANVLEASRAVRDHKISFLDAQIWASAKLNQMPFIFSEDFADGSTIEGVRFVNPFDWTPYAATINGPMEVKGRFIFRCVEENLAYPLYY